MPSASSRVYVDTSGLIALLRAEDVAHGPTRDVMARLVTEGQRLVTTTYVAVETSALLTRRFGLAPVQALDRLFGTAIEVLGVPLDLHWLAWREVLTGGRSGPSLVDWAGFLTMRGEGIETAVAVDGHFRAQGFRVLPG